MGLVFDFYAILTGGLYLIGKGTKEMFNDIDVANRAEVRRQYAASLVDEDLEQFFRRELAKPESREAIWEALERFKRENPMWCRQHDGSHGLYCKIYAESFGWQHIGTKRLPSIDAYNIDMVLDLLMDTQGKKTKQKAKWAALEEYPCR